MVTMLPLEDDLLSSVLEGSILWKLIRTRPCSAWDRIRVACMGEGRTNAWSGVAYQVRTQTA